MAARFNAERAADLEQQAGDSTPIMATIPTDDPWVPIRILGLGADGATRIEADVFLLTDDEPGLLAGGTGMTLERSELATGLLLDDLRSDVGMEWLPAEMWLSYLKLDAPAGELDYDLAISASPGATPDFADTGVPAAEAIDPGNPPGWPVWPLLVGIAAGSFVFLLGRGPIRRRFDLEGGRPA
jgi:hypothetical protein